jgi:hypothetical protein
MKHAADQFLLRLLLPARDFLVLRCFRTPLLLDAADRSILNSPNGVMPSTFACSKAAIHIF